MLFSEPKIPQSRQRTRAGNGQQRSFSALQRAENSSMLQFLEETGGEVRRFSALQRAENSSI